MREMYGDSRVDEDDRNVIWTEKELPLTSDMYDAIILSVKCASTPFQSAEIRNMLEIPKNASTVPYFFTT